MGYPSALLIKEQPMQSGNVPRTLEAHNLLGTLPEILRSACTIPDLRHYELPGGVKPLGTFSIVSRLDPTPATPFVSVEYKESSSWFYLIHFISSKPNPVALGQDVQERILRARLERLSGCVELGIELRYFEQRTDGIHVTLARRQDDQEVVEVTRFDYLLGADGAHSSVRKELGFEFRGVMYAEDHMVYLHVWGDATNKMITLRPTKQVNGVYHVICFGRRFDRVKMSSSRAEFIKEFYALTGRLDIKFGELIWLGQYRPNVRMVSKLHHGNVFLIGDAAHCHSPTGAQGMNSSFQDAVNLGWKLALVINGLAPPSLLATYGEERLPVIKEMLDRTTELLNRTFEATDEDDIRKAWQRGGALNQLGVNYRMSSVVFDEDMPKSIQYAAYGTESETGARAGDRAPDAPGLWYIKDEISQPTTRFFKIFKVTHHTILIFSAAGTGWSHSALLHLCKSVPSSAIRTCLILPNGAPTSIMSGCFDYVLLDGQGHAFANYHVPLNSVKVFAIRPDGIIGAVVNGAEGLDKYFAKVFCS
ncbi:hypothetical protein AMATHDRAFT_85420 [Amanita thiersii Skay4041]|uniref:FAD-binding domain-containing protein n=1 Tax=Amanita thiersii Skay4041 TaxID=703135 RepID=A0A2A9NT35_9AGAR|nr:hypothetical protein AMATHDRAFT_85420 [Amanita thiersii Skay4041]